MAAPTVHDSSGSHAAERPSQACWYVVAVVAEPFAGTDHPQDAERVSGVQAGAVRLPFHVRFAWHSAGQSDTLTDIEPSAQANQNDADNVPFSGAVPNEWVPVNVADCPFGIETISGKEYGSPERTDDNGVGQEARQTFPSQVYHATQAKVHCPAVAEWCQFQATAWEVAVDAALAGTVDPQMSATQTGSVPVLSATNPASHTADIPEIVILENEQVAVALRTPSPVHFSTVADSQDARPGTSYQETSALSHGAGPQVSAPSTSAHVPLGSSGSRTSPPTDPSIHAG